MTSLMTSFITDCFYSYNIYPTKVDEDQMKNGRVIVLTSSRADFTGNDVTDGVIVTKINRVLPYPPRNNPVKFHQDRIRFSRVFVFTSSRADFTGNDFTDDVIITSFNRVRFYSYNINPLKFGKDQSKNG